MTNFNNKLNMERHWLNWCRLCANDYAIIDVRQKDAYMRIISKCFDVEIGQEQPALGAMLCNECYSSIGNLINFVENVSKVQPIFELLRHTEPSEQVDVLALRHQYGLQKSYKIETPENEGSPNGTNSSTRVPAKRKRGRPKKIKESAETTYDCKEKFSMSVEMELVESHIFLPSSPRIEEHESYEDLEFLSDSPVEPYDQVDQVDINEANETIPIKRKRGRPRKNPVQTDENESFNESTYSKCKNVALARLLLASPEPELHISEISVNNTQSFTCNICDKTLSSEAGLRQHNERIHIKRKPVVCDCCGKRVNNSSELKEHMLVHTDERPFRCAVCSASFKNKKRLNIHSQIHGMPKYKCEICGKMLQTRAIWNKHKYVHTNERRFKCSICGTATKHSTALKVHLLSHTGFRPYACKYCNKAFASGANCRDHKMKKHPVEFANDDDKSSRIQSVPTLDELRALAEGMEKGERLRKLKYTY